MAFIFQDDLANKGYVQILKFRFCHGPKCWKHVLLCTFAVQYVSVLLVRFLLACLLFSFSSVETEGCHLSSVLDFVDIISLSLGQLL